MKSQKFIRSLPMAGILLGVVLSTGMQFAFAKQIECTGGFGRDAVTARIDLDKKVASISKQSPELPRYTMSCGQADGVLLRCEEAGGRKLLVDSLEQARYVGSRQTTSLSCIEVFSKYES